MEIANLQTYTSSHAVRLVDTGNHVIINTVPYTKDTNSPIPFNNISIIKNRYTIAGANAVHPHLNCLQDANTDYTTTTGINSIYTVDKKAINMIIDNVNPNISYVMPSWGYTESSGLDSVVEPSNSTFASLYKITTLEDGTVKKDFVNIGITLSTSYLSWQGHIYHMTQNDDYVFVFFADVTVSPGASCHQPIIVKINKHTFTVEDRCYIIMSNISNENYKTGNSNYTGSYYTSYYPKYVCRILYENEGGFLFYCGASASDNSNSSSYRYCHTRVLYFSFESCTLTDCVLEQGTLTNTQLPMGLPTVINSSAAAGYNTSVGNWKMLSNFIPSKYLETDNEIYGYFYAQSYMPTSSYPHKLYYMNHSKNEFMTLNLSEIALVFPEDSAISSLPDYTGAVGSTTNIAYYDHRYIYETMTSNHNGVDYVHIFYKGISPSPVTERGIYTFEISEDKTQATFKSFYPAIDGSLHDYMVLNEDRSKIVLITQSSFHILKFDTISKSWVPVHDEMVSVKSMIQTAENKLYYLGVNRNIYMLDLNGAVMIDFNFEKQSYNYNNVDINSYISIWAKDSEGNYCDTNIKLTITGNAVWQENGIQTLETATSSSGPIEIPFVIKGHTAINVGVDAII